MESRYERVGGVRELDALGAPHSRNEFKHEMNEIEIFSYIMNEIEIRKVESGARGLDVLGALHSPFRISISFIAYSDSIRIVL